MIINFNNIGSVTGGGGTPSPSPSNYRIVNSLSSITNPTEGLMAYVKAKTKTTNGVRIEISDWDAFPKEADGRANGYLTIIQDEDWDESTQAPNSNSVSPFILIGNQFIHFENDGKFHSTNASHNGDNYTFVYKTHNGEESGYGSYVDLYMIDSKPCKLWLNNGCSTAVTTTPYVEITPGQTYLYSAGQWVEIISTTFPLVMPSTSAETTEFVAKIRASVARGIYPSILIGNDILIYNGDSGDFIRFAGYLGNERVILYFSDEIYNSDGFDDRGFKIDYVKLYNLPVASANELGGVKIGQGISIDQDGVISAQGGGSGGYNVVDSLPETGSATEGALYYVKPYVESVEYRGISITTTASEDYVAHIYDGGGNEKSVYISGTDFHWGYQNDGQYHKKDDANFWYKTDNANKTINVYLPDNSWTVTLEGNATSAETSPYTVQISHDGTTYRFNGTGYTIDGGNDNIFYFGNDNFSRLMNLKENGVDLSQLTYVYNERQYALFNNYDSANNKFIFRLTDSTTEPIGTPLMEYNIMLEVTEGGDNQSYRSSQLPMTVELDMSSSGLSTGYWVRTIYGGQFGGNPIILRSTNEIWTQNVWFRPFYNADNSTWESLSNERKIFGAEFYYRGKKIVAEWLVNGEGGSTVMNWTETELSTANSTPPQA